MNSITAASAHDLIDRRGYVDHQGAQVRATEVSGLGAASPLAAASVTGEGFHVQEPAIAGAGARTGAGSLTAFGGLIQTASANGGGLPLSAVLSDGTLIAGGLGFNDQIRFSHFSAAGEFLNDASVAFPANYAGASNLAALTGGGFAVVFYSNAGPGTPDELMSRAYSPSGAATTGFVHVNTPTTNLQSEAHIVATADGGYFVAYSDGSASDTAFTPLVQSDNTITNNGATEVTDVRGVSISATGLKGQDIVINGVGKEAPGSDPSAYTGLAGEQRAGGVAQLTNASIVTVYRDTDYYTFINSGNGYSHDLGHQDAITARIVTEDGATGAIQVDLNPVGSDPSSHNTVDQYSQPQVVALTSGGFAVVWSELDGSTNGIYDTYARFFDADGAATSTGLLLLQRSSSYLNATVALAQLPDGGFAVAYETYNSTDAHDVRLARVDGAGEVTSNVLAASGANEQNLETLSSGPDGSLYLGYYDANLNSQATSGYVVQRYVASGKGDVVLTGASSGDAIASGAAGARTSWIDGQGGNDTLTGAAGPNHLYGGAGDDIVQGGRLSDTLDGGTGFDTVSYAQATGGVTIALDRIGVQHTGPAGKDLLTGFEGVSGSAYGDRLTGDAGANVLEGMGGADTLVGGAGADTLTGGIGADMFVFAAVADTRNREDARDHVTDLNRADGDKINLAGMDAVRGGSDDAFTLVTAFSHHAGELVSIKSGAHSYIIQGDVDGDGKADFGIEVLSDTHFVRTDFVL